MILLFWYGIFAFFVKRLPFFYLRMLYWGKKYTETRCIR